MKARWEVIMRVDKRTELLLVAVLMLLALLIASNALAQAEDPEAYGDDYQPGNFGRIQFHDNGLTILRAPSESAPAIEEAGAINSPVFPGDAVLTDVEQRAEVQLARGSVVRVDRASDVTFLALPDPYATFPDNTVVQVAEGAIRISAMLAEDEEFRIDTPASSIYLLSGGDYRIEVGTDGQTRVLSRRGVVEFVGKGGSILVRAGQASEVFPGALPSEAEPFNTFLADNFDRWVEDRDSAIYLAEERYAESEIPHEVVYEEIPYEVRPYYEELSVHGSWSHTSDYGYVWYPNDVPTGWRPYHDGYWAYETDGYFWVANEPWGWAPYHFGRWTWIPGHGWSWVPGRVFGGAWVAWSWGSVHVGWSPLDYWNRPAFVSQYYLGYYDPYCWTFIRYENFTRRNYAGYVVTLDRVGADLHGGAVVTRPPRVSPARIAVSPESRNLVQRRAHADRQAAIPPLRENVRGGRTLAQLDERLLTRGSTRQARNGAETGQAARPGSAVGSRRGVPAQRRGATDPQAIGQPSTPRPSSTRALRSYPRQISTEDAVAGRRETVKGRRYSGGSGTGEGSEMRGRAPGTRAQPRSSESQSTNRRLRDLYESMARPRTTRDGSNALTPGERASGPAPRENSSSDAAGPRPTRPRSNGRDGSGSSEAGSDRSNPRTEEERGSGSGSSPRESGTRQKARSGDSNSGSGGSRPSATRRNDSRRPTSAGRRTGGSSANDLLSRPRETTRATISNRMKTEVSSSRTSGTGNSGGSRATSRPTSRPSSRGGSSATSRSTSRPSSRGGSSATSRSTSRPSSRGGSSATSRSTSRPSSRGGKSATSKSGSSSASRGGSTATSRSSSRPSSRGGKSATSKSGSRSSSRSGSRGRSSGGGSER
jgi:hypothetical protein